MTPASTAPEPTQAELLAAKIALVEQLRAENAADYFPSIEALLADSGWRPAADVQRAA